MQVIILAAGASSRFEPFSDGVHHKSETVIAGKPILAWTMEELQAHGATNLVVVANPNADSLQQIVADFRDSHPEIQTSIVHQSDATGMADAILACREHLEDSFLVVTSGQVTCGSIVSELIASQDTLKLVVTPTSQPEMYGVVSLEDDKATSVVEKPQYLIENPHRVVGIYKLSSEFVAFMSKQKSSEYALEESLNLSAQQQPIPVHKISKTLPSLKYSFQLLQLKDDVLQKITPHISESATIHSTAVIEGDVIIEDGATIAAHAIVEQGSYIGKNAVVGQHCIVRKKSCLETEAVVQRHCDISNSILMSRASIHTGFLGDSIIGSGVKLGAGFITGNKRFDRQEIKISIKKVLVSTGLTALGVMIGNDTSVGIQVGSMPGVIIASHSQVKPGKIVTRNSEHEK